MHTGLWILLLLLSIVFKTDGCEDGYYGNGCRYPCPTTCVTCSGWYNCNICKAGYYGYQCNNKCPDNCLTCINYQTCTACKDSYNGTTCRCTDRCQTCFTNYCSACKDGYYGQWCERNCRTNCLSCKSGGSCVSCRDGYFNRFWNDDCSTTCSPVCKSCSSYRNCTSCPDGKYIGSRLDNPDHSEYYDCRFDCQTNCKSCSSYRNCTLCIDGKYNGKQYDVANLPRHNDCRFDCKRECASCTSYYKCNTCINGWYNNYRNDCSEKCKTSCLSCTSLSNCTVCRTGNYGSSCQLSCGKGCTDHQCDKRTGTCTCRPNFQGDKCDRCILGHYGSNCENSCNGCEHNNCTVYGFCVQGCKQGFTGYKCDQCEAGKFGYTCTAECPSNCQVCMTAANCTACKRGYFGERCLSECPLNCKRCTSDSLCNLCNPGYYGHTCTDICATNCQNQTCFQNNGTCVSCIAGFHGRKCEIPCPVGCSDNVCDTEVNCLFCKKGYYGPTCMTKCPDHCEDGICNKESGKCNSCITGYYKDKCDVACSSNCKQGTPCRQSDSYCKECTSGFSYNYCREPCSNNCKECQRRNPEICTECIDGRFGFYYHISLLHCSQACSPNCLNITCSHTTGFCDHGCIDGYWGHNCRTPCPENCKNRKCFINNGICVEGCNDGYKGFYCNCRHNCDCNASGLCITCIDGFENAHKNCKCSKSLCSDISCSSCNSSTFYAEKHACCPCSKTCKNAECETSSKCSTGCESGYFGDDCSSRCKDIDPFCADCSGNYARNSGVCLKCDAGYYPDRIYNRCNTCPTNCTDVMCSPVNGTCTLGCVEGRWGNKCERSCASSCIRCQQTTGTCLICEGGKYSSNCTEECSENCNSTRGVIMCGIENGTCLHGCSSLNKFGVTCENNCSINCLRQACAWKTGHCLDGCMAGYFGKNCDHQCNTMCTQSDKRSQCNDSTGYCVEGCIDGWYGTMCEQKCSEACIHKTCDRESGTCFFGCADGFEGSKCIQALEANDASSETGMTLGLAVGAVAFVLVIIGIIIVFVIIKRRNKNAVVKKNDSNENRQGNASVTFSEVRANEIAMEQDYAVYARPNKPRKRGAEESTMTDNTNNDVIDINPINNDSNREHTQPSAVSNPNHGENAMGISDDCNNMYNEITEPVDVRSIGRTKCNKPPVAARPTAVHESSNTDIKQPVFKNSKAKYSSRQSSNSVLEIEEDISILTSPTYIGNMDLAQEGSLSTETGDYAYYNVAYIKKRKVALDKLAKYVSEMTKEDFVEEFNTLPAGLIKPYTVSQKRENVTKNRYKGIYPYDKTRVILKEGGSDYINASFIDGYKKIKAYIASIGPTYKYMGDMSPFWRMVWQEKVGKIVMLTKLSEAGEPKCDKYWPDKGGSLLFTDIRVTTDSEEIYADYTVRSCTVQINSEVRCIIQAHFTAWPDKGTPDDVTSLIEFRQKVNSLRTELDGPMVVHCSAGIGRTGTYIAVDSLTQEGDAEGGVDIYACVRNLREQRMNMVQTAGQYQYLHNAVVHILTFDSKPIKVSKFHKYMSTLTTEQFTNQFKHLQVSIELRSEAETDAVRLNEKLNDKNRPDADIPGENNRPRLHLRRNQGMSCYINALYVNSFRSKNRFLVAQTPLPNTVEDFLTLIVQENVSCIVTMETNVHGNKTVGTYYPVDSQPLKVGCCTVQSESAECTEKYVLRKLKIMYEGKSRSEEVTVTHIQYTRWSEKKKIPDDQKMFMQFVKEVELKYDSYGNDRPILVHCLTGAEKSGLFCVVSILLEKIQLEQEISVVNTVRQVKNRRHRAIPNKEQYMFCHQCLDEYLHTFDTYSNFSLEK